MGFPITHYTFVKQRASRVRNVKAPRENVTDTALPTTDQLLEGAPIVETIGRADYRPYRVSHRFSSSTLQPCRPVFTDRGTQFLHERFGPGSVPTAGNRNSQLYDLAAYATSSGKSTLQDTKEAVHRFVSLALSLFLCDRRLIILLSHQRKKIVLVKRRRQFRPGFSSRNKSS